MDLSELCTELERGRVFNYLFFFGHRPRQVGRADASCLSQWFAAPFEVQGQRYATAEHWMMAEKARLFEDAAMFERIVATDDPAEAKALGREVRGFDQERWSAARFGIVVAGGEAKFGAHEGLRTFLLGTGDEVLVEATPRDRIWGIGMGRDNPAARDPRRWRGKNLLGFSLMEVRRRLSGG